MSDIIDDANDKAARDLKLCIEVARKPKPLPPPTGLCFNCGETIDTATRWCDDDCRDDWQFRNRRGQP